MRTAAEILQEYGLHPASTQPGRYYTTCPQCSAGRSRAHQRSPCLGITIDEKGVRWGCSHCGWTGPEKGAGNGKGDNTAATYDYRDANGTLLFQKVRKLHVKPGEGRFWVRRPDGRGGWIPGIGKNTARPLYRLPEVSKAIAAGHTIVIVEGEKDADNLWRIGVPATCNFDGAADTGRQPKWKPEYSEMLRGADLVVLNDNDPPGYAHADAAASMSVGIAKRVRRLDLAKHWPDMPKGHDVSDWITLGHTREQLDALIERAPAADSVRDTANGENKPPRPNWRYHDDEPAAATSWAIKNILPETGAGLISGQWGSFKTTVALDVSVSLMSGLPFAGRFKVKRRGAVICLAPEGAGGLKSRLDAIAHVQGVAGVLPFAWSPNCPALVAPGALDELTRLVEEAGKHLKKDFDLDTVLIWIDTIIAAASYAKTGDDNDQAAAQKIMSVLSRLSERTGALAVGLDHFGKVVETGTRGSSAKEGHADVVLAVLADRELSGTVTNTRLAVRKMREGASGLEIPFTAQKVEIGTDPDGDPITRVVIDWGQQAAYQSTDAGWSKSLQLLRRILMTMLADAGTDVKPFADGPTVRAVSVELVRAEFYKQYVADGDARQKAAIRRMAFNRAIKTAHTSQLIATRELADVQLVWLVKPEAPQ